jgi:hypothetical protein
MNERDEKNRSGLGKVACDSFTVETDIGLVSVLTCDPDEAEQYQKSLAAESNANPRSSQN